MATLGIGMKPATLPVAAFGVGIGVDYSIYLWSVFSRHLEHGTSLREAYYEALRHTGKAVLFTSASLVLSVFTRSEERRLGKECVVQVDLGGGRSIKKTTQ